MDPTLVVARKSVLPGGNGCGGESTTSVAQCGTTVAPEVVSRRRALARSFAGSVVWGWQYPSGRRGEEIELSREGRETAGKKHCVVWSWRSADRTAAVNDLRLALPPVRSTSGVGRWLPLPVAYVFHPFSLAFSIPSLSISSIMKYASA